VTRPFLADRPVDQDQDRASVERGGLPLRAQRRIHELNASQRPLFTSTLTPAETIVCRQNGMEAVSQVMGASVYHVGWRGLWASGGGELKTVTAAYENARQLALSRMQQEAALLHAHAVVGVKVDEKGSGVSEDLVEFSAVGTAVRIAGMAPAQYPALTLMEADELYKLHGAGYWPVGIALGNCFWYEPHADCASEGTYWSSELLTHARASRASRDLAVARFREFSRRLGGEAVVGVKIHRRGRDREYESNNTSHVAFWIEILLLGTTVVRRGDALAPPRPELVLDLAGKSRVHGETRELAIDD
jgi:uncharacterized protein YbjQ (UPF0145 family)